MRDLQKLRPEIDKIDNQIIELFKKRMSLSEEVAEYKAAMKKEVFDRAREKEKLEVLSDLARDSFERHCIEELFSQIMAMSRKRQYHILEENGIRHPIPFAPVKELIKSGKTVAYQGVEGAYSHQAALQFVGDKKQNTLLKARTFREAMEFVRDKKAEYAVLPIENSSAGIVNDCYDLLVEFEHCIVEELFIRVEHALLGLPEANICDIKTVYSHPQGLMQCAKYLEQHKEWQQAGQLNTAGSALKVLQEQNKSQAAIASELAGQLYGLKVLESHINDNLENTTRFVIITNHKIFCEHAQKISICFEIPHKSGSLYTILSHFIFNNLNMTKIESRPLEGRNWEYRFFVDFEGNLTDASVQNALRGVQEEANHFRIIGNY